MMISKGPSGGLHYGLHFLFSLCKGGIVVWYFFYLYHVLPSLSLGLALVQHKSNFPFPVSTLLLLTIPICSCLHVLRFHGETAHATSFPSTLFVYPSSFPSPEPLAVFHKVEFFFCNFEQFLGAFDDVLSNT